MDPEEVLHWAITYAEEDSRKSLSLYSMVINRTDDAALLNEAKRNKGALLLDHGSKADGEALLREAAQYYSFTYLLSNDPDDVFQFAWCAILLGYEDECWSKIDAWIEKHPETTKLQNLKNALKGRRESKGPNKPAMDKPDPASS